MQDYIINPRGIATEHFPDETIILNLPKGNYYSLRGTGQLIWEQLEKRVNTDYILHVLSNQYATTSTIAQPALETFLNQLFQEELIQENTTAETTSMPEVSPNNAGQPFVAPALEVYTDMQELLMLDPIHDSDAEKGWPYKTKSN